MERRDGQFYYYCAIPKMKAHPTKFILKDIPAGKYLVVEHQGAMDQIYATYEEIYHKLIPKLGLNLEQTNFYILKNMTKISLESKQFYY